MTTNEDAPAVAENAEPVEASLALALDAVWTNLATASACLDRWHEADKPTAALPVTGPGSAFVGFLRMAAELSVLNGPKDAAVAEVREVMLPVADTYFGSLDGREEIVEGLAPRLVETLRHYAVVHSANDMAKKCPVFGIAADWTELHKGVMARDAAQLTDVELHTAMELLAMVRKWEEAGRSRLALMADLVCATWLSNFLFVVPEFLLPVPDLRSEKAKGGLAAYLVQRVLRVNPEIVLEMAAQTQDESISPLSLALSWVAIEWWVVHLGVVERSQAEEPGGGPLMLTMYERRLAREFLDAAVAWDDKGRPLVLSMDAAAGAWLVERRAWMPKKELAPLAHEHALELLLTNPLELVAPSAPVDPAAV